MWEKLYAVCVVFLFLFVSVRAGQYCNDDDDGGMQYCPGGCCGGGCCIDTAAIVGAVIGGLFFLIMGIGCLICLCCMYKKRAASSSGVYPMTNSNSVVVHNTPYGHPPPHAAQPPSYSNYSSYPVGSNSGFSYSDPVYPPGMVTGHPPPSYSYSNPSKTLNSDK